MHQASTINTQIRESVQNFIPKTIICFIMPILALKFNFLTNTSYFLKEKFKVFIATNIGKIRQTIIMVILWKLSLYLPAEGIGSQQQSYASSGKPPLQLSMPQMRPSWHSLSKSQSPSIGPHFSSFVQHAQLALVEVHFFAKSI